MPNINYLTVEEELEDIEAQIAAVKVRLAELKQKRRELYAHQSDRNSEAMARAAAELGLDYDAFLSQINRYKNQKP